MQDANLDNQIDLTSHRRIRTYDDANDDDDDYGIINWPFRDIFTSCRPAFMRCSQEDCKRIRVNDHDLMSTYQVPK